MMKDYRRMMEQVTLSDRKKEEIMDMLENQSTQKRRKPPIKALVLAAALAVGCVLCIAAGLPTQVYNFMGGGSLTVLPPANQIIGGAEVQVHLGTESPIILEDGRLWFVNGEERTDVTDLIDENTPYIYERTDPATGNKGYIILGGTVDSFGWAQYVDLGDGSSMIGDNFGFSLITLEDGNQIAFPDLTEEQRAQMVEENFSYMLGDGYRPWVITAMEQLGIGTY